jgi:hypothetical protein
MIAVMIVLAVLSGAAWSSASEGIQLIINGQEIEVGGLAGFIQNRVIVPLRLLAEALGAKVSWDPASRKVTVEGKVATNPFEQVALGQEGVIGKGTIGSVNFIAVHEPTRLILRAYRAEAPYLPVPYLALKGLLQLRGSSEGTAFSTEAVFGNEPYYVAKVNPKPGIYRLTLDILGSSVQVDPDARVPMGQLTFDLEVKGLKMSDSHNGPGQGLTASIDVAPASASVGQARTLILTVSNTSAGKLETEFASSQEYDFEIISGGKTVWQWSEDKFFLQVISSKTISPGSSIVFRVTWDGKGSDGKPLPPGTYKVTGRFLGRGNFQVNAVSEDFVISP